nr:barstar family protein [Providencia rustigianii]
MNNNIIFDFCQIRDLEDFYCQFQQKLSLPSWFGHNLDALWDMISGEIELPMTIIFSHLSLAQQHQFAEIIDLMNEAEDELEGRFIFLLDIPESWNSVVYLF